MIQISIKKRGQCTLHIDFLPLALEMFTKDKAGLRIEFHAVIPLRGGDLRR
ncbi:hypothetical protein ACFOHS_02995 [Jhaorihella thermophila]